MKNICDFVVNFTVCLEMLWFFPRFLIYCCMESRTIANYKQILFSYGETRCTYHIMIRKDKNYVY